MTPSQAPKLTEKIHSPIPNSKKETKMTTKLRPPLKWHGGKHYLAKKIVSLMPRHLHFVEPYAGGLAVLLEKDPHDPRHEWGDKSYEKGTSEVVNDLNGPLTNFWRVLKDDAAFTTFRRIIEATPFSEAEWLSTKTRQTPQHNLDVKAAAAFFIRCRQSLAGRMKGFAPLSRTRTRRGMNEQASAWLNAVEGLPAVHQRLQGVVILCQDALQVIRRQDGDKTLFYLDPPYHHATRTSTDVYKYEMSDADHRNLLNLLTGIKGKFILSGYPNPLYDGFASTWGWNRVDFDLPNNAAGGEKKKRMIECIWMNYQEEEPAQVDAMDLPAKEMEGGTMMTNLGERILTALESTTDTSARREATGPGRPASPTYRVNFLVVE